MFAASVKNCFKSIENLMIKNFLLYGSLILAAYHSKHQITNDSCYLTKHQMISGFMGQLLRGRSGCRSHAHFHF